MSHTSPENRRTTVIAIGPADWRIPAVAGVLTLIAGIVVLVEPHGTLKAITVVVGIYLLIVGILIGSAAVAGENKHWGIFALGVLAILGGIFVILNPGSTIHAVRIVLAFYLVLAGLWRLGVAFSDSNYQGRRGDLFSGTIDLIAGIVLFVAPSLGLTALAVIVGIYLILRALLYLTSAWMVHGATR